MKEYGQVGPTETPALTKMNDYSIEELWMLVHHYERLIQLLLEELEKANG